MRRICEVILLKTNQNTKHLQNNIDFSILSHHKILFL
jgi:hypothetical protein